MSDVSILDALDVWMAAPRAEQDRAALGIARRLPPRFRYTGLVEHEYAGLRRVVARFVAGERLFALLPGVRDLTLGFRPELLEIDAVARTAIADEVTKLFETDVETHLGMFWRQLQKEVSPRRTVSLAPFLIQEVAEERGESATATVVDADLAKEGARLPTEDEWEYACGAGRDAFFRWGTRMPCEAWPPGDDGPPEGEAFFVDAMGPNAFGLQIAHDPHAWEFCATPDVFRGGDGGSCWCGGEGTLAIWRALGTPFRSVVEPREIVNPFTQRREQLDVRRHAFLRRVYPLAAVLVR